MSRDTGVPSEEAAQRRVIHLAETYWTHGKDFLNHGPKWEPSRWERVTRHESLGKFVWDSERNDGITRRVIQDSWLLAQTEQAVMEAFFLTMVWGFGSNSRGPWKTEDMIEYVHENNLEGFLVGVRADAATNPLSAYESVLAARIPQLGPVYSSKLLYAMGIDGGRTPVLDVWVARWGRRHFRFDFQVKSSWSPQRNREALGRFQDFCLHMMEVLLEAEPPGRASSEHDPGFVEYLVFWDAKYRWTRWRRNSTFPDWVTHTLPVEG